MAYFPMFVDMTERECLIVGGGNVAYRKVSVMLDFGAKVTVVAEDICDELRKLTIDAQNDNLRNDMMMHGKNGSVTFYQVEKCRKTIYRLNEQFLAIAIKCAVN